MKSRRKISFLEIGLLIAIALGVILRLVSIDIREFWYDEVLSLLLATGQKKLYIRPPEIPVNLADYKFLLSLPLEQSLSDFITTLEKLVKGLVAEPHPPLFYLGQHFWLRLTGNSAAAMRGLPVLYSLGAIFASFGLGKRLLGFRGGLLLAAALSLNPFFWFHSLNVRMYCGLVFWVVLSGWATVELIALYANQTSKLKDNILWSIILVISIAGGFSTFYYFGFWMVSLGTLALASDGLFLSQQVNKTNFWGRLLTSGQWLKQGILIFCGFCLTTQQYC